MTLMEALVALVILALVAVGCLELSQGASSLEFSATQWNSAITMAESRMAEITTNAPGTVVANRSRMSTPDSVMRAGVRVTRDTWRPGFDVVTVTVPVSGQKTFVLRRVFPSQKPLATAAAQ